MFRRLIVVGWLLSSILVTLVVCNQLFAQSSKVGRWLAGGGTKPVTVIGETDDYGYNIVLDPVHIHDLHATLLHCLGFDHERLSYATKAVIFD